MTDEIKLDEETKPQEEPEVIEVEPEAPQEAPGKDDDTVTVFSISRKNLKLVIKVVIAIVIGFLLAFAAPPVIRWLAAIPREAWYIIGVAVAVISTAVLCLRNDD